MYTDVVVKVRLFAFAQALLFAATPVLGVVCQMDCDQQSAPACHHSMSSSGGSMVRGTHVCDHDHGGSSPALQTGTLARDSFGAVVGISVPMVGHAVPADGRPTFASTHGPPRPHSLSTSSLTTVLRI